MASCLIICSNAAKISLSWHLNTLKCLSATIQSGIECFLYILNTAVLLPDA